MRQVIGDNQGATGIDRHPNRATARIGVGPVKPDTWPGVTCASKIPPFFGIVLLMGVAWMGVARTKKRRSTELRNIVTAGVAMTQDSALYGGGLGHAPVASEDAQDFAPSCFHSASGICFASGPWKHETRQPCELTGFLGCGDRI